MLPPPYFLYLFFEKPTFTSFIKALEQKVGFEIGLQPKTIKRALGKVKNTPQTQARLDEFSKKFAEKSGVPLFDNKHIGNAGPVYSYWPHWLALAEHTADNFPLKLYPATRALIREMAYHERDKIADAYKRFDNIPERLCFFADDESKKNWVPDIIRQNLLDHCLSCNPVHMATESMCFKLWASHIMISTFLRILAWFDVEYTQAMLKLQQKQGSPRDISFIEGLVPHQAGSNIVLPVRSLFESWKEFLVAKGRIEREWVEALAGYINGGDIVNQKRMLYGWLSGEHIPSGPHIKGFLKNIQAIDDDIDWEDEYKWFCLAAFFQRLYRELEKYYPDLSKEDIVLHFQAFTFHSQEAIESLSL